MFPGQDGQFGAPFDPNGGGLPGGVGGPPSADSMFESFLEGDGDESDVPSVVTREQRDEDVLAVGLHFFERMKGMR
jgi:hypothetical protein